MDKNNDNTPRSVPMSHGFAWLMQSLALMRLQAGRLMLVAVFMQLILGLTSLPLIGLLIIISVPGFSAGVLEAFDVTRRGGLPGLNLLFRPLTSGKHSGRLLLMGVLVFVVGILTISLALSGSEELLDPQLLSRIEQGDVNAVAELDQETIGKLVMAFLIGMSVSGTLSFFTIPLVWFSDRKLGTALGEGIKALLINWKPFLALTFGLFVILIPLAIVAGFLVGLAAGGGVLSIVVMGGLMMLALAFQMLLFGTQYCSFRDIFGSKEPSGPPAAQDDGQLVA